MSCGLFPGSARRFRFTKRQMSSTWPCVSSPARPAEPERRWSRRDISATPPRIAPGHARIAHLYLRLKIALLGGEQRAAPVDLDAAAFQDERSCRRSGVEKLLAEQPRRRLRNRRSFRQSLYLAQALKWKWTMAVSDFGFRISDFGLRLTKIGPLSRIQPRLVGCTMNWTRLQIAARAPEIAGGESLLRAGCRTRRRTVSPGEILRTISP